SLSPKTWWATGWVSFLQPVSSRSMARTPRKPRRNSLMEVHSSMLNVRMSAQKMREVARQIQGLNALQAQAVLAVVPRKSARFVAKTLSSALANAEHIRSEWNPAKIEQTVADLRGKLSAASDRKKRGKYTRELAMY